VNYSQKDYDKMIESLAEIHKEYGHIRALRKGKIMYRISFGYASLTMPTIPEPYKSCPCGSDAKYKFCCKEFNPKPEAYLT